MSQGLALDKAAKPPRSKADHALENGGVWPRLPIEWACVCVCLCVCVCMPAPLMDAKAAPDGNCLAHIILSGPTEDKLKLQPRAQA